MLVLFVVAPALAGLRKWTRLTSVCLADPTGNWSLHVNGAGRSCQNDRILLANWSGPPDRRAAPVICAGFLTRSERIPVPLVNSPTVSDRFRTGCPPTPPKATCNHRASMWRPAPSAFGNSPGRTYGRSAARHQPSRWVLISGPNWGRSAPPWGKIAPTRSYRKVGGADMILLERVFLTEMGYWDTPVVLVR